MSESKNYVVWWRTFSGAKGSSKFKESQPAYDEKERLLTLEHVREVWINEEYSRVTQLLREFRKSQIEV